MISDSILDNISNVNASVEDNTYEVEKCVRWIDSSGLKKVCLQFPDNLLPDSVQVAVLLEKHLKRKVYILGDTTCGSCCVDEIAAQHIDADGIIHFGHACLNPTTRIPVFHVLPKKEIDVECLIRKFKSTFQDSSERILFFYDVSYAHKIEVIHKELSSTYTNLVISLLNCISNMTFTDVKDNSSTVILGRSFTLENKCKVEDYSAFFLGEDGKTLTTLSMSIPARKWYCLHETDIVECGTINTPWLKRRRFLIEKLKDAKVVGIVVATLGIKEYLKAINMVKSILKQKNVKSYILSVGKINPPKLANFPEIDAFVVIACPENEVFDSRDFLRPILMPYEVELAFNDSRELYTQHCMDFRQILPGGMNYIDFKLSENSDVSLITGEVRGCNKEELCADKMNSLIINSSGELAMGKAGAQFLHTRSWTGVEQRLGKDAVHAAEIGRSGLASHYKNEPVTTEKDDA